MDSCTTILAYHRLRKRIHLWRSYRARIDQVAKLATTKIWSQGPGSDTWCPDRSHDQTASLSPSAGPRCYWATFSKVRSLLSCWSCPLSLVSPLHLLSTLNKRFSSSESDAKSLLSYAATTCQPNSERSANLICFCWHAMACRPWSRWSVTFLTLAWSLVFVGVSFTISRLADWTWSSKELLN